MRCRHRGEQARLLQVVGQLIRDLELEGMHEPECEPSVRVVPRRPRAASQPTYRVACGSTPARECGERFGPCVGAPAREAAPPMSGTGFEEDHVHGRARACGAYRRIRTPRGCRGAPPRLARSPRRPRARPRLACGRARVSPVLSCGRQCGDGTAPCEHMRLAREREGIWELKQPPLRGRARYCGDARRNDVLGAGATRRCPHCRATLITRSVRAPSISRRERTRELTQPRSRDTTTRESAMLEERRSSLESAPPAATCVTSWPYLRAAPARARWPCSSR